jgi:hypothetical protein
MVTYEDVVQNIEVRELIKNAQKQLDVLELIFCLCYNELSFEIGERLL